MKGTASVQSVVEKQKYADSIVFRIEFYIPVSYHKIIRTGKSCRGYPTFFWLRLLSENGLSVWIRSVRKEKDMKKKVIVLMSVIVMASGLNACSNNQSATSVKEISEAGTYRTTGLRTKSFISSMGCYNENCTDSTHYHHCNVDCDHSEHYHDCAEGCAESGHYHNGQHHTEEHHHGAES